MSSVLPAARPTAHADEPPPSPLPWHAVEADEILRRLDADPQRGLTPAEVERRRARHGTNELPQAPRRPLWRVVAHQFRSPLIYLLLIAAGLALVLGHISDAAVIVFVLLLNAAVGALQEGRAERSMEALRRLSALQVRVQRDGREQRVPARELVPGDVLLLAAGDEMAADARLIEAAALQAAEAALTGESVPVAKQTSLLPAATGLADRHNMVFSGTYCSAGRGRAVVVATGVHTEVGRIAGMTGAAQEPQTPLQRRIEQFGRALVVAALTLFALVMALGLARGLPAGELLMVAISQMVSMVPEGLPVAMTIALAVGMQRMAARRAIVRRLSAVETLGSTTVICSDKTGTLTRNRMTVTQVWLPDGRRVEPPVDAAADAALRALLEAAALCNDAPRGAASADALLGDPTEIALRQAAHDAGIDLAALDAGAPREAELPFDSDTKLMATRHRRDGRPHQVLVKGAPEAVLRLCAADAAARHAATRAAEAMASQALRVLGVAVVDDDPLDPAAGVDALRGRARLLGLVGELDPPRDEAKAAVEACRQAGIRPLMITGDHKLTGLAIARTLGIARDGDLALDGAELERMGEPELQASLDRAAVFARVQPAQKLRIVEALQARGEVVAMTGDGVNDAPALARADVGVAMGITGTEVAKSAAKIVVTDDNFATIVDAVEQGRVVYGNLKKVILFLFVTSLDEVLVLLLALVCGLPLPLLAVQILWINIVTEGLLTVNLVLDPPDGDEMRRAPVPRDDPLIDRGALGRLLLMMLVSAATCFGWFVWRLQAGVPLDLVRTETFTLLAMCQWFNVLNCRSATRSALSAALLHNGWLVAGLLAGIALQFAVLYWTPLNALFHTQPIAASTLLPLAALASLLLWTEEARKLLARRRRARAG